MPELFAFILALSGAIILIPPLIHVAGRLQLVDIPDHRKVHTGAVPRVGGIAMVGAFLLPSVLWVPFDPATVSFLLGVVVLFIFGVLDDRGDLDYKYKFLGQFVAAALVILYGDVRVDVVPFFGYDAVPAYVSIPLTFLFIVGVTNAINLADGLDGLAAGTTVLSLAMISLLAWLADAQAVLLLALIAMGAVVGFLRFNTHPARIFMGDTGSQFLGFTVATLAVVLTQSVNSALNPALPLLILGMPILDTIVVMVRRIMRGQSPFKPDKKHVHHQLLALAFDHHEAVILIYLAQSFFVLSAFVFRYESDLVVVGIYVVACSVISVALFIAGRSNWRFRKEGETSALMGWMYRADQARFVRALPVAVLGFVVPLYLLVGAMTVDTVTPDLGLASAVLFAALLVRLIFGYAVWFLFLRFLIYMAVAFVGYLVVLSGPLLPDGLHWVGMFFFGLLALLCILGMRYSSDNVIRSTPTDVLVALSVIGLAFLPEDLIGEFDLVSLVVKMVILFYASEILIKNMKNRWNFLTVASLAAFGLLVVKAFL